MTNWKRLYTDASIMLDKYQNEVVPKLREQLANRVEVVRCKDCKCWCYEYDDVGLCVTDVPDIDGVQRLADDFCSYGEKREV